MVRRVGRKNSRSMRRNSRSMRGGLRRSRKSLRNKRTKRYISGGSKLKLTKCPVAYKVCGKIKGCAWNTVEGRCLYNGVLANSHESNNGRSIVEVDDFATIIENEGHNAYKDDLVEVVEIYTDDNNVQKAKVANYHTNGEQFKGDAMTVNYNNLRLITRPINRVSTARGRKLNTIQEHENEHENE